MAFADVGKAWKDVSGGHVYDHKVSYATKLASGISLSGSGALKADNAMLLDAKGTYKLSPSATLEATVTHAGKVTASLSKDNAVPGLKATLSATLLGAPADGKLALQYAVAKPPIGSKMGVKADFGLNGKITASTGVVQGAVVAGVEAEIAKGAISKYAAGAQMTLSNGGVASALLADKDTVKLAYVHKCTPSVTGGVEVVHKLAKGSTTATAAASKKLDGGATAKASLTTAGILSVLYSGDVQPKTTAALALQVNAFSLDKPPKMGVQFSFK